MTVRFETSWLNRQRCCKFNKRRNPEAHIYSRKSLQNKSDLSCYLEGSAKSISGSNLGSNIYHDMEMETVVSR